MTMDRGELIKHGFSCEPAENGGWIVSNRPAYRNDHGTIGNYAAFSTFGDMIAWLEDQHEGLKIGEMKAKHPLVDAAPAQEEREAFTRTYDAAHPDWIGVKWWKHTGIDLPSHGPEYADASKAAQEEEAPSWSASGCGYGCNDQVASTQCPIHGGQDA